MHGALFEKMTQTQMAHQRHRLGRNTNNHATTRRQTFGSIRLCFEFVLVACLCTMMVLSSLCYWPPSEDRNDYYYNGKLRTSKEDLLIPPKSTSSSSLPPMIVYFSQGPAKNYKVLKGRFQKAFVHTTVPSSSSYQFYYHSYDEDCDGCIYQPNTTFAEGWNLVVKTAIQNTKTTAADRKRIIKYYVRFDDDIELYDIDTINEVGYDEVRYGGAVTFSKAQKQILAWRSFHQMLLSNETTHPLIRPQDFVRSNESYDVYESCVDGHFYAISADHHMMSLFFPFSTYGKRVVWVNDHIMWSLTERCFPAGFKVDHRWTILNKQHRYTTDVDASYNEQKLIVLVNEALNSGFPQLGPWTIPQHTTDINDRHRCTVKEFPSIGYNEQCSVVLQDRYQQWLTS